MFIVNKQLHYLLNNELKLKKINKYNQLNCNSYYEKTNFVLKYYNKTFMIVHKN